MSLEKKQTAKFTFAEKKSDLIFAGIALILIAVMMIFLFRYFDLREQNQAQPEEYGAILQDLNDVKEEKNRLESEIDAVTRDLTEISKQITALSGK